MITAAACSAGCDGWPRHAHLPESDEALVDAGSDVRDLVEITWTTGESTEPDDTPVGADVTALDHGDGVVVSGALDGVGWADAAEQVLLSAEGCDDRARSPLDEGDYLQDVDFVVVEPVQAGALCASASLPSAASYGWDLILYPLDACDLPASPVLATSGEPVGLGLGGVEAAWSASVAPGRYAVLLAGYAPNDPSAELEWELALSLVGPAPDGLAPVCPLPPWSAP